MNAKLTTGIVALALGLTLAAGVSGAPKRASGTLQLNAQFEDTYHGVPCAAGTPVTTGCFLFAGNGVVPGLGRATLTYTLLDDEAPSCDTIAFTTVVIQVAGKGEIDASLEDPSKRCWTGPRLFTSLAFTVIAGSGAYAGASGSGSVSLHVFGNEAGTSTDTWAGTLTVPGRDFDVTAPILSGAKNKTVKAPRAAKRARVTYKLTGQDDVDGAVPVVCKPPSGSRFKVGKTTVHCSATDSSGNAATARFVVTVRRSR